MNQKKTRKIIISIIITNFNGNKVIRCCLESVLSEKSDNFEVIIVDDCSKDGSYEFIKDHYQLNKKIKLIRNSKNVGAAGARNIGAKKSQGKYLFFLDNDAKVGKGWYKAIISFYKDNSSAAAIQPKQYIPNTKKIQHIGDLITPLGFIYERAKGELDKGQFDQIVKIFALSGSGFIIKRDIFTKLGGG